MPPNRLNFEPIPVAPNAVSTQLNRALQQSLTNPKGADVNLRANLRIAAGDPTNG
jgi:hypothetical protein